MRTFSVTRYSLTAPFAAVTDTTRVLVPSAKSLRPAIKTVASESSAMASTITSLVSAGSSSVEPSATSDPFSLKELKLVFELRGATTTLRVIILFATKSAAVISISISLLPTCKPVRPETLTVAAESLVTATMFTEVVLAGRFIV